MPPVSHTEKTKITVTLSLDIVRQLDALLETSAESCSRSQLVEEALRQWIERRAQRELERQTEEYYRARSVAEREEDLDWSAIASKAAERLWEE